MTNQLISLASDNKFILTHQHKQIYNIVGSETRDLTTADLTMHSFYDQNNT